MKKYRIKLSYPRKTSRLGIEDSAITKINITKEIKVIYDAVTMFEESIFSNLRDKLVKNRIKKRIKLAEILNIHNSCGIKNVRLIKRMLVSIKNGKHTLTLSGMPNVKILKTRNNKLFLFDGHHSMLAYMAVGKKYLHDIPYLMIENKDEGFIRDNNIINFFGGHLKFKRKSNWYKYTINWQAPKRRQLRTREQKNMGELFENINNQYNISQYQRSQ